MHFKNKLALALGAALPPSPRSPLSCITLEKRNSPVLRCCTASMRAKARAHAANSPAGLTAKTTPATAENAFSLGWSNAARSSGSYARCRHEPVCAANNKAALNLKRQGPLLLHQSGPFVLTPCYPQGAKLQ